jgi:hypothetical protein
MKEYSPIDKLISNDSGVEIIPKTHVKIQKVSNFRSFLKEGVDFAKLRKAFLVGERLIV